MSKKVFQVDPRYNPNFQSSITSKTPLAKGVKIAKFLGGYGDQITLSHIKDEAERKTIARHLYLHAHALLSISENQGEFEDYRLVIAEGVYRKADGETLQTGSINDLATEGRAIVYELRDSHGNIAVWKTFDLAVYWKDNIDFEKLILDYDTFNPDDSLNAQIILIMPETDDTWEVDFDNILETRFNNYVQGTNELIEVQENLYK